MLGVALTGCSPDGDELQQWMEQQKREVKPSVPPLTPPKKFDPEPYAAAEKVEPFSSQKLSLALKQVAQQSNALLSAEQNRRKEALEAYPLDDMRMVGSLNKHGQPYALVRVNVPAAR